MKTQVQTVGSYLGAIVKAKKNGAITLDEIQKKFTMLPRNELIRQVRAAAVNNGKFVIGRRGQESRFLFGVNAESPAPVAAAATPRAPMVRAVGRPRQLRDEAITSQGFSIKVRLGGGEVVAEIPVNLELAAA